jgi:hypothetical protein
MSVDLSTRRSEAEAELQAVRLARGKALLDGRQFAHQTRIDVLTQFLEALNSAEGVAAEREREAAEVRRLQRLADLRCELAGLEEQRLEAFELAEMACRNLVDNINRIIAVNARMMRVAHAINEAPIPTPLMQEVVVERIAGRMAGVLCTIKGYTHKFSHFVWPTSKNLYPAGTSWAEKERRLLAHHLEPLIAGATPKPTEQRLMIEHKPEKAMNA